eukprot:960763-Lingulodinium_polyedra.AAC.1
MRWMPFTRAARASVAVVMPVRAFLPSPAWSARNAEHCCDGALRERCARAHVKRAPPTIDAQMRARATAVIIINI